MEDAFRMMELFLVVTTIALSLFVGLYIAKVNRGYAEQERQRKEAMQQSASGDQQSSAP